MTQFGTHRGTVVASSAVVSTGVVAAAVTGSYVPSVISVCGALVVACITALTANWRQNRALSAEHEQQNASILAEDRRQATEFAQTREAADLADMRSVLETMIRAVRRADDIRDELTVGGSPQQDELRTTLRSIQDGAILCRLRLGAHDSVTMRYLDLQSSFATLLDPDPRARSTEALLAYSISRERFSEIATERFGSHIAPAARLLLRAS